jgi:hypothetical protein
MKTITQTAATAGQVKQINRFASDAIEKVLVKLGLDNPGAQRVIEHGDEFANAIREAALESLKGLSITFKYQDEEVKSTYVYPKGHKVKGITEQTNILRQLFPGVGFANEKLAEAELPQHAEGWFAIPKWQTIAPTYNEAVEKVLEALKKSRKDGFFNYRDGKLGSEYLRQHKRSVGFLEKLTAEQPDHDILVVPAQFGLRHRGRSARRAREVFQANEFGLGAFAVGIMILTHPERFTKYEDICVDCSGDEYAPDADGDFSNAPSFRWDDGRLEFGTNWTDDADGYFGAVSAFGSQQ